MLLRKFNIYYRRLEMLFNVFIYEHQIDDYYCLEKKIPHFVVAKIFLRNYSKNKGGMGGKISSLLTVLQCRSEHVYLKKCHWPTCLCNFCGSYYGCCLTMHLPFIQSFGVCLQIN